MAIGSVVKFNTLGATLYASANRQWDDATAGSCMFILADNTYVADPTHITSASLSGVITAGNGAPINVGSPAVDATSVPGTTAFNSAAANFGTTVTITAKFLICVQPVIAGSYHGTTDKLLWYVDLNTLNSTASLSSTASNFILNQPVNGWYSIT